MAQAMPLPAILSPEMLPHSDLPGQSFILGSIILELVIYLKAKHGVDGVYESSRGVSCNVGKTMP
jgi:hypothetical protein